MYFLLSCLIVSFFSRQTETKKVKTKNKQKISIIFVFNVPIFFQKSLDLHKKQENVDPPPFHSYKHEISRVYYTLTEVMIGIIKSNEINNAKMK